MNTIFKNLPDLQEYFETSDGEKFFKEDLAKNHVRTFALKDATIKLVLRPDENQSRARVISLVPHMKQELVTKYLNSENDADEPNEEFIAALTNRNAQLQTVNSAASSAKEFENSHATINTIVDNAVVGNVEAGAPFKVVDTAEKPTSEMNTVIAPVETANFADGSSEIPAPVVETSEPIVKPVTVKGRAKTTKQ